MTDCDVLVPGGIRLRLSLWPGEGVPFLLLHGLASNRRTWDLVAARLSAAGHPVAALDQRGHGESERPEEGYDFATVSGDAAAILDRLGWEQPVVMGQSWGGNVALAFGARYPGRARGLGFVDGGFIDLRSRSGATWESVARDLRPPDLGDVSCADLRARIEAMNPEWSGAAVEATLGNFECDPGGAVRRRLPLDRHMRVLRALWDHRPRELYGAIREGVVLCVAENGLAASGHLRDEVGAAQRGLRRVSTHWFPKTSHDIHVHRPQRLAWTFLAELEQGVWSSPPVPSVSPPDPGARP